MTWTIDNILTSISIILVAVGGVFAMIRWSASNKIKRAEFANQIIEKFRFDRSMADTMRLIDYDISWYNQDFHKNEELEYSVDKFLSYLSYVCFLHETGIIKSKEFDLLRYKIARSCISPNVQTYLWNVHHFAIKSKTICSFESLIKYGIDNKYIDQDFYNSKNEKYIKILNLEYHAEVISGAEITKIDHYTGEYYYKKKCESCGYVLQGITSDICGCPGGTSTSVFTCPKCGAYQKVVIGFYF